MGGVLGKPTDKDKYYYYKSACESISHHECCGIRPRVSWKTIKKRVVLDKEIFGVKKAVGNYVKVKKNVVINFGGCRKSWCHFCEI